MTARTSRLEKKRAGAAPGPAVEEDTAPPAPVYVLAPVGRDAPLGRDALREAGLPCTVVPHAGALPERWTQTAGALVLTEEALTARARAMLCAALAAQAPWSDVPLVVLVDERRSRRERTRVEQALRPSGNVTVLGRPLPPQTLVAVVQSVLHGRAGQHEVQRLLAQIERARSGLEERVRERTSDLRARNRQVRSLAASLTVAEQKERERIARVLHDEFQQLLYGYRLHLQALRNGVSPGRREQLLDQMDEAVSAAIDRTRTLASELNPPEIAAEGFRAALHRLADRMEERYGLTVDLRGTHPGPVLRRELRVLLFRLVRELLFNVIKHAGTDRATLTTGRRDGGLTVCVEDEGAGFAPEQAGKGGASGFGLFSMQERLALFGGTVDVETARGEGTQVTLTLPLQPTDADEERLPVRRTGVY